MGKKLLEPIKVGNLTLKNRIMFPPLTTGYEERDGSIGERSLNFYERLAKGGAAYVVIGDVAPVRTASPTPKLYDDSQLRSMMRGIKLLVYVRPFCWTRMRLSMVWDSNRLMT